MKNIGVGGYNIRVFLLVTSCHELLRKTFILIAALLINRLVLEISWLVHGSNLCEKFI